MRKGNNIFVNHVLDTATHLSTLENLVIIFLKEEEEVEV